MIRALLFIEDIKECDYPYQGEETSLFFKLKSFILKSKKKINCD